MTPIQSTLSGMHIESGIDVDALMALRKPSVVWLHAEAFHGSFRKTGLPRTFVACSTEAMAA